VKAPPPAADPAANNAKLVVTLVLYSPSAATPQPLGAQAHPLYASPAIKICLPESPGLPIIPAQAAERESTHLTCDNTLKFCRKVNQ
jgi:hypothetical protein